METVFNLCENLEYIYVSDKFSKARCYINNEAHIYRRTMRYETISELNRISLTIAEHFGLCG